MHSSKPATLTTSLQKLHYTTNLLPYRRLVNEMEEVYKAQDFNLVADARTPDGLYTWDVSLAGFSQGSQMAQASLGASA